MYFFFSLLPDSTPNPDQLITCFRDDLCEGTENDTSFTITFDNSTVYPQCCNEEYLGYTISGSEDCHSCRISEYGQEYREWGNNYYYSGKVKC